MRNKIFWLNVAIMVLFFILVCIGLVKTMNKTDSKFDNPPTTGVTR